MRYRPLSPRYFSRSALHVAKALVGTFLIHDTPGGRIAGRIVETEAYDESDAASHSYVGLTSRNRVMFGPGGFAYVYRSYGIHWCMNVTCGPQGYGAAVLLRALEPLEGLELMAQRRSVPAQRPRDLCRGPGRLTQALGITDQHYGLRLRDGPLWIARGPRRQMVVACSTRIGISKAQDAPWRFFAAGSPFVSGPGRLNRAQTREPTEKGS